MKLTITEEAKAVLEQLKGGQHGYLKLFYDTDGCGCGVNGVPTVRWAADRTEWDDEVENADYQVLVHRQQAVFFDDQLKLDLVRGAFRLSSPQGILNPVIPSSEVMKGEAE
ncbi:iron-sulfur cluster biosynthesis family protein [Thalassobacillus hwangdonensis]|uniref:Iron-sulfur cluster biosynthesis family protein n=1 Tax=Thalassobacillus hwangdonensis TaxID=546108 RepID=A0ABW3KY41_9BACI